MQGIYTYIPETNYVPREYSVVAIPLLLFMVLISSIHSAYIVYSWCLDRLLLLLLTIFSYLTVVILIQ